MNEWIIQRCTQRIYACVLRPGCASSRRRGSAGNQSVAGRHGCPPHGLYGRGTWRGLGGT